jgi:sulfoxide reductase heme-binding subunit YedZ
MSKLKHTINSPYLIWVILGIPLLIFTWDYLNDGISYGEYIHLTGDYSAKLLIATLAVTPLRLMFPNAGWNAWLLRNRRYFGVAAFAYAVPHLLAYAIRLGSWAGMWADAADPGLWTGWLAFFIFIPLAVTSNNISMRKMGRNWKLMHRLVYFSAVLTLAHWFIVAFDPMPAMIHAGVLAILEVIRLGITYWPRGKQSVA